MLQQVQMKILLILCWIKSTDFVMSGKHWLSLQVNVCLCRLVEYLVKENPSCIPLENRQSPKGCQTTLQIPWKEHPIISFTRFETFHNFC